MGAVPDSIAGKDSFASFRQPAWHGLGTVFTEEVTTVERMVELANMKGQNIRKVPIGTLAGIPSERFAREMEAIVRTNPATGLDEVLSIASPGYEPRQVEEILGWIQFGPTEGARWETAGQMKNGTQVFASIALDREIVLDPEGVADVTKAYMLVAASFDGSLANRGGRTAVRVVCENTLDFALRGVKQSFSFKSTKNIRERVGEWQREYAATHDYFDAFEKEAQALYATPLPKPVFFNKVVPALYPKPEKDVKGSFKKWDNRVEGLAGLWNGPTNAGLADTAWKAVNVLTEGNQWLRQVRSGNTENAYAAGAGFDGPSANFRQKALDVVKTFA